VTTTTDDEFHDALDHQVIEEEELKEEVQNVTEGMSDLEVSQQ
jgi:hypothetical protein